MKNIFAVILGIVALGLPGQRGLAADATTELNALVTKINSDVAAGKRTESGLADDIKQFDVLLAEHKGEKTDDVARILYMKATLYGEVLNNDAKEQELFKQLETDFAGTQMAAEVEEQDAAKKIQDALAVGTKFPDFNETDVAGQPLTIASHKGKVVMIDFWATWCGPCRAELPNVIAAYQKYHAQGFDIIGVSLDEDKGQLLSYLKDPKMTWPQYFDGQGWTNKLAVKYGIRSIPATYLLDGEGRIIGKDLRGDALGQAVANAVSKK